MFSHRRIKRTLPLLILAVLVAMGSMLPGFAFAAAPEANSVASSTWQGFYYVVKPGDTLSQIARQFGTTVQAIKAANGIKNANQIKVGQVLWIPTSAPTCMAYHTVRKGQTLSGIAKYYGVSVKAIKNANGIKNVNKIQVGQVLCIPWAPVTPPSNGHYTYYTVRPGDTLNKIALHFGTTVQCIAYNNHIKNPNRIYVGQVLLIADCW